MSECVKKEVVFGYLFIGLGVLDELLWGGIFFGVMIEIVGFVGIGKI